ncbi:hypothetical protein GCM10025876_25060 [Demequina litorisediminis]|uniref:DUF1852 domain-containing protein n=1 Tax=Demequina litorisediminis TaxID=1849022 RepID=A0ABQ6IGK4_9MICO|nr:hypothetical protein GCM10025876_25060 [Demequina litorisediminis]
MTHAFTFSLATTRFDEDYTPSANTRATTNFANLARGEQREQNLRSALTMINRRVNDLARWDNPRGDRYSLDLDIVSAEPAVRGRRRGAEPSPAGGPRHPHRRPALRRTPPRHRRQQLLLVRA